MQTAQFSYKRIAFYTALVLATLALAFVVYRVGQVVLLFTLSIILAAALRVPMMWLQRRRLGRGLAILLLYACILGIVGLGIYLFGGSFGSEVTRASERLPAMYNNLTTTWPQSDRVWQRAVAASLPDASEILASFTEGGATIAYELVGLTYGALSLMLSIVVVLTLTYYWLLDEDRFINLWLTLLPIPQRVIAREAWIDIDRRIGLFVRSEALQFMLTFVLLWSGLRLLGVGYPTLWALYGGIAQLIPWIGIPLIALPVLPLFLTAPLYVPLGALVLIVAVGFLISRVINPWAGVSDIVHPIVSVLALILLGEVAGILGMLVALPLAATLQTILSQLLYINTEPRSTAQSVSSSQLQTLRIHLAEIEKHLPDDDTRQAALDGIIGRVNELLDKTEQLAQEYAEPSQQRRMIDSSRQSELPPSIFEQRR